MAEGEPAMNGIDFAWPWCFLALPLPWLARRLLQPAGSVALRVPALPPVAAGMPARASAALLIAALAWLLLVVAAMRPQAPGAPETPAAPHGGRDLLLAFDVSASMATRDLEMDGRPVARLDAARALAGTFLRGRDGDRVGLIVFGAQAYLHTPLTFDLVAVRDALGTADTGLAGRETALGDAIALATKHLRAQPVEARVLVLLSDGASTAGTLDPMRAAWLAQREKVRVHTVGIGAAELDAATLKGIAEQTGGLYARATDAAALRAFFDRLTQIELAASAAPHRPVRELYPWPLGAAFVLSCWLALRRAREVRA
ncbi:MAG TPA: VWA domain-containing protein [Telluria sp.]|nr:VWA domain-containing protein [Telluria sp.]